MAQQEGTHVAPDVGVSNITDSFTFCGFSKNDVSLNSNFSTAAFNENDACWNEKETKVIVAYRDN